MLKRLSKFPPSVVYFEWPNSNFMISRSLLPLRGWSPVDDSIVLSSGFILFHPWL